MRLKVLLVEVFQGRDLLASTGTAAVLGYYLQSLNHMLLGELNVMRM